MFNGSVADQMGILPWDIVYGINGGSTKDPIAFCNAVFGSNRVSLNILRGNLLFCQVRLGGKLQLLATSLPEQSQVS